MGKPGWVDSNGRLGPSVCVGSSPSIGHELAQSCASASVGEVPWQVSAQLVMAYHGSRAAGTGRRGHGGRIPSEVWGNRNAGIPEFESSQVPVP